MFHTLYLILQDDLITFAAKKMESSRMKYRNPYHLDTPEATCFNREIILQKKFLHRLYSDWYACLIRRAKTCTDGICLEIGSGGGFLKDMFPEVVTSDILELPFVDVTCDAERLPFFDNSLSCIILLNVFHHIPHPYLFLEEAQRSLAKGGKILMLEPANSLLGRWIYTRFHHESFDPKGDWEIPSGHPLTNANQAFSYIYFERDRHRFAERFQHLRINHIRRHTPFLYLVSGGLSHRACLPPFMYGAVKFLEWIFSPFNRLLGLFCTIEIEKTD